MRRAPTKAEKPRRGLHGWFRNHALSTVMLAMFLFFLGGQILTGRAEYNEERHKEGAAALSLGGYLRSAHFGEATAENWESEFFQMFVFVLSTAFLYQRGSAESKDPRKRHEHECVEQDVRPNSPWPVRRGGWILRIYEHSLSGALFAIFLFAFGWHAVAGHRLYNEHRLADGQAAVSLAGYVKSTRFWFESFQNWQSEFLAIAAMVLLSIWLREVNSPESKDVAAPHWENEE